jgi:hypothetical protein
VASSICNLVCHGYNFANTKQNLERERFREEKKVIAWKTMPILQRCFFASVSPCTLIQTKFSMRDKSKG